MIVYPWYYLVCVEFIRLYTVYVKDKKYLKDFFIYDLFSSSKKYYNLLATHCTLTFYAHSCCGDISSF